MKSVGLRVLLLMLPLSYGLMLAWQEWQFRQSRVTAVQAAPTPVVIPEQDAALNTLAVATVFGFTTQGAALNSTEPLTLRATVVASGSESRALLAGPEGERFYRTGERLPGGSLLRRIEPANVVLWRQDREERLSVHLPGGRFLQSAQARPQSAPTLHLRPTVEQTRSE